MAIKIKPRVPNPDKDTVKTRANQPPAPTDPDDMDELQEEELAEGDLPVSTNIIKPILKAVRANCLDCCGGMRSEVQRCIITSCPMHPYRFGTNPFSERGAKMTDEERKRRKDRMTEMWAKKKALKNAD